jgi:hypothetical protein
MLQHLIDAVPNDSGFVLEGLTGELLMAAAEPIEIESDGLHGRLVDLRPHSIGICGHIWTMDQAKHAFWLEASLDGDRLVLTLHYDIDPHWGTDRRRRDAIELISSADEVPWRITATATAVIVDGRLTLS